MELHYRQEINDHELGSISFPAEDIEVQEQPCSSFISESAVQGTLALDEYFPGEINIIGQEKQLDLDSFATDDMQSNSFCHKRIIIEDTTNISGKERKPANNVFNSLGQFI